MSSPLTGGAIDAMNEKSILQALVTPLLIALAFALGFSTHWAMVRTSGGAAMPPTEARVTAPAEPAPLETAQSVPPTPIEVEPASAVAVAKPAPDVWPARHLFIEVDGQWLSQPAKDLIREIRPGGVLLRSENINSPAQTLALAREIKEAAGIGRRQLSDLPIVALALTEQAALDMLEAGSAPIAALASASSVGPAREFGAALAGALAEHGVNALFGPVLDVGGASPMDAAYATRVISSDRSVTTAMGLAETDEVLRRGILCAVGTFPGYGAAARGPSGAWVLAQDTKDLAELLYPFSAAAAHGVPGIIVGHVAVPAVDKEHPKRPASQSPVLVRDVLRGLWSYDGVVIADDLTSEALGGESTAGAAAVEAVLAGCDAVIVGSADAEIIRGVCAAITQAVADGALTESALTDGKRRLDAWIARLESPSGLEGILPELPGNLLRVAKADEGPPGAVSPPPAPPVAQEISPTPPGAVALTESELQLPESGKLEEAQGEYQAVPSPATVGEAPPGVATPVETAPVEPSAPTDAPAPEAPVPTLVPDSIETTPAPVDASSEQAIAEPVPTLDQPAPEPAQADPVPSLSTEIPRVVVPAAVGDPTIISDVEEVARSDAAVEVIEVPPSDAAVEVTEVTTPGGPPAAVEVEMTHMVLPGETIVEIAAKYGVEAGDIQAWNELPNLNVEFGKALTLRVKPDVAARIRAEESERPSAEFEESVHAVATGETLTSIAEGYGVQIRDLVRWNGLTDSRLQVGKELKVYRGPGAETIEAEKPETTTYQVKKGDTLTQISRRFDVPLQEIMDANNLGNPNEVIVGQRLTIPVKQ